MGNEQYKLDTSDSAMTFEFTSEGPKGQIPKIIRYTEVGISNFYNLGFGDRIGDTKDFDDKVVSDNKDSLKVLSTVVESVSIFTDVYPEAFVFATGSTPVRTRLYQIGISNNLEEILEHFQVLGMKNNAWEKFEKNQNYVAFLITRK